MRQIRPSSDIRLDEMCSYCGKRPGTKDHVPSKVLLEQPFPENLAVVPCCDRCNQGFSLDEEYLACLLECIIEGTTDVEKLKREKIKDILKKKESLRIRIQNSMSIVDGVTNFEAESSRVQNVLLKLAKGHAKYENSEPMLTSPDSLGFMPIHLMTQEQYDEFTSSIELQSFPEVGSRALYNVVLNENNEVFSNWVTVQSDSYYYSVISSFGRTTVRIIIREYLAAQVIWES